VSSIASNLNHNSIDCNFRTSLRLAELQYGNHGRPTSGIVEEKRRSLMGLAREERWIAMRRKVPASSVE